MQFPDPLFVFQNFSYFAAEGKENSSILLFNYQFHDFSSFFRGDFRIFVADFVFLYYNKLHCVKGETEDFPSLHIIFVR